MAMMLALSRNIAPAYQSLVEGKWDRNRVHGHPISRQDAGHRRSGTHRPGRRRTRAGLEMQVLGYDPFLSQERARSWASRCSPRSTRCCRIDYLTVHTPLTDETRHLISTPQIQRMRKGVRLINCARGGIYDEAALVEGLKSGQLGGVALDVFTTEPCTNSPLFGMPGVLCTPHLGASTEEAQTQVAVEGVNLLVDYLVNGSIRHAVNFTPIDAKSLGEMRGYLSVGYRLGLLMARFDTRRPSAAARSTTAAKWPTKTPV